MAIATRSKPRVQHKKRAAKHHRRSKHYLKAYHPYLPVVLVLALGALANNVWPNSMTRGAAAGQEGSTRIEILAADKPDIALLAVIAAAALAFTVYLSMNLFRVHRLLNRGEKFVVSHPWLDVILVAVCTAGVLLTRRVGLP